MDRYSTRNNTTQFGASDYVAPRGRPVYKKEFAPSVYTNSTTDGAGYNVNNWETAVGDPSTEKTFSISAAESILPTPQPSGFQSAWSGMPGQVSMADIVKMGRQHGKTSSNLNVSQQHMSSQHYDSHASQNYASKDSEVNLESEIAGHHSIPLDDAWLQDEEPPAVRGSSVIEHAVESEPYNDAYDDRANLQYNPQTDDVRFEGDDTVDDEQATFVESHRDMQENSSLGASGFDNDHYQNIGSYQVHHNEVEDPNVSVTSMTNNFEGISLSKDEDTQSEGDSPTVKIPEHLKQTTDLSHLSFGSFGSGMGAPFSGSFASRPVHDNEEEAAASTDAPSVGDSEARNSEYYEDGHLRTAVDGNNAHRIDIGAGSANFEAPSVSQTDMLQQEAPEVTQLNQYSFPSTTANYMYDNNQQLNSSFGQSPSSSQMMQGLPSLPGVMPYSNSLPSSLLASNMHALREAELAYSQFPTSQSIAAKYAGISSLSGPTTSMAEALKTSNLAAQPTQSQPGGSVSGATGLPQHLAMHPYSQHSVPVGPLNMMGYPFLHQGYSYMPSAFQQAFAAGNSTYPQSLAAMLPQYKNNVSLNSLPQSGAVPSGYGGFGNSNNIPSNFSLNPPSGAPPGNSMNYEDILTSQYKDASHLLSLQQGADSRTMSGVPGNTYYSSQGQNQQQPAGFRQSQQPPSQHYGAQAGYPNYYHSQGGLSLDHQQQQMLRDGGSLGGGSQGQQPKQSQQHMWQNSY
ncbi:uncharacterized protein LOC141592782 isoform X2 [Silene latifolia]